MTEVYTELLQENSELGAKILRLEQENKELLEARNHFMRVNLKYFNALEEIRDIAIDGGDMDGCVYCYKVEERINEVLE